MVTVTSPRNRQAQERLMAIQLAGLGTFLLALLALFFTLSTSSTTDMTSSISGNKVQQLLRLPIKAPANQRNLVTKTRWPPLSEVYDGRKVIADPQFLLDFAIVGFEKCGTSTLMQWLGHHPEVQCFQEEIYDLYRNRTGSIVWRLHTQLEHQGFEYKRGYKSPVDIFNANALHLLDEYFPKTRLLVALRHPVLWYESLYNFRIQNLPGPNDEYIMPLDGIGHCKEKTQGVCTENAFFAQWMYRMGKTLSLFPTPTEQKILASKSAEFFAKSKVTRNPVFLMELNQLIDTDATRKNQLQQDLKIYLGLKEDLQDNPHATPGKKWPEEVQAIKNQRKMNICEEQYVPLRKELMRVSRLTSQWILESFVQSDSVFVSSPDYFEQVMSKWMEDPCDTRALPEATQ